nr:general alpha-glucoside permease [Quercus suber]
MSDSRFLGRGSSTTNDERFTTTETRDEASPLLHARRSEDQGPIPALSAVGSPVSSDTAWVAQTDHNKEQTRSSCLQIAWSVELSNGSPYLLSLGISKSLLAVVWIAGPLSGTLVQPYVGIKSDRCRSRFGKRRPFMVGGAAATIVCLLALSWAKEIISGILGIFGVLPDSDTVSTTAITFAILMIYVLDFAINVIQAAIRAFIVDNAPTHQQDGANAWATRLTGIGSIVGYLFGYTDLPRYLWFFGDTQFKILCVIASLAMIITLTVSCLAITERDPRLEGESLQQEAGVLAFFKSLLRSVRKLPPQIKAVCQVQFFAWIGWFPFLFYTTTYIAEIYAEPFFEANPNMTPEEIDETWEKGTRVGTFALLICAIVTFSTSVVLPLFVANSFEPPQPIPSTSMTPTLADTLDSSGYFGPVSSNDGRPFKSVSSKRRSALDRITAHLNNLTIPSLTLRRTWLLSLILFFILMWLTFIAQTVTSATVLVALIGVPWSVTCWAPFALIAEEISKRDSIRRGLIRPPPTAEGELLARGEDISEGADQAGTVLGIHNVAIAAPQVIATLVSSGIFKALQKSRGTPGDNSVAWVLRFGGCAALFAAWWCRKISEQRLAVLDDLRSLQYAARPAAVPCIRLTTVADPCNLRITMREPVGD